MKPFKSTSGPSSSGNCIQCKISVMLVCLLSLLLSMQCFCIIHEDRFGITKNHRIGKEVIYCTRQPEGSEEGRITLVPFLTPCNGDIQFP